MSTTVWKFELSLALPFFVIGKKTDIFQPVVTEFSKSVDILSAVLYQYHLVGSLIAQLEPHHLH